MIKYDVWNRLVEVKNTGGAVVATYRYDGANRRVTFYDGTNTRHYYYSDEWQVLEERLNSTSTYDQRYVFGLRYIDDLVLRDDGGTRHYCLSDYFSITAIVNTSGTVLERYTYDAFGKPYYWSSAWSSRASSSYSWETLYGSYRYDTESGMYQVRNRYLHPNLGRWITRDPIGEIGFEPSSQMELDAMGDDTNLYTYVRNNSTNYIDLSGLGFDFSGSGCPSFVLAMIQSQFAAVCQTATANNCCSSHLRPKGAQNVQDLCNGTHTRNTVKVRCRWNCDGYCGKTVFNTIYICLSTKNVPNPGNTPVPNSCYPNNPWGCILFHESAHAEGGVGPDSGIFNDDRAYKLEQCAGC